MDANVTIRPATADDAAAMTAYVTRIVDEPHNNVVLDPGQWTMTVEEERAFLQKAAASGENYFVVAEIGDSVVGVASIGRGKRPTERHVGTIGVSVDRDYRRRGIGTALMRTLLDWAREQDLRRLELQVFERNPGAIALYEKLGFVKEGLHKMAFLKQGVWVDEYTMALILPERNGG